MAQPRSKAPSAAVLMQSGLIPQDYLDEYNSWNTNYSNAINDATKTKRNLLQDLGLAETGPDTVGLDPTNAFGAYQNNLRSLADQLASSRSAALQRGLGRKGLAAAKERLLRFATSQGNSQVLGQGLQGLGAFNSAAAGALAAKTTGQNTAYGRAADWWAQNAPDDPTAPPAATPPPGQDGGPPPPPSSAGSANPGIQGNLPNFGNVLDQAYAPFQPTSSPGTPALAPGAQVEVGGPSYFDVNSYIAQGYTPQRKKGAVL